MFHEQCINILFYANIIKDRITLTLPKERFITLRERSENIPC